MFDETLDCLPTAELVVVTRDFEQSDAFPEYATFYDTVEALQADLDAWLVHYNTQRPHLGYRNMGRRPIETVMSFVSQEG